MLGKRNMFHVCCARSIKWYNNFEQQWRIRIPMFQGKYLLSNVIKSYFFFFFFNRQVCFSFSSGQMYVISFFFFWKKIQLFLIIKQYCRNLSLQCENINYYVTSLADFRPFNRSIIITNLEVSGIQLPHSSHLNLLWRADNSYKWVSTPQY